MRRHWLSGPYGAGFRRSLITYREDEVHERRTGTGKLVPVLTPKPAGRQAVFFNKLQRKRIYGSGGVTACAECIELALPE
jgi:hypothetical protein